MVSRDVICSSIYFFTPRIAPLTRPCANTRCSHLSTLFCSRHKKPSGYVQNLRQSIGFSEEIRAFLLFYTAAYHHPRPQTHAPWLPQSRLTTDQLACQPIAGMQRQSTLTPSSTPQLGSRCQTSSSPGQLTQLADSVLPH